MKVLTLEQTKQQLKKFKFTDSERYYIESLLDLAYALGNINGAKEVREIHDNIWEK